MVLLTIAITSVFSYLADEHLIEESEDDSYHIVAGLERELRPFLVNAADSGTAGRLDPEAVAMLQHFTESSSEALDVDALNLFDANGSLLYRSRPSQFAAGDSSDSVGLQAALAGSWWSESLEGNDDAHFEGQSDPDARLIETYSPIFNHDGSQVLAVLELYRDVGDDYARIMSVERSVILVVVIGIGLAFTVLAPLFRRSRLELAATSSRLTDILINSADAIVCADENGNITLWNRAAQEMMGYTSDEVIGQPLTMLLAPEDLPRMQKHMPPRPGSWSKGYVVAKGRRKDGAIVPVELSRSLHYHGEGVEFSMMARDVSERVRTEEKMAELHRSLQEQNSTLEKRVSHRTAELQEALDLVQESDRLKSELISNVNHELRTPVSNIKLYLTLLKGSSESRREDYMATLFRETERLEELIEDLLHLARFDQGKVKPNLRYFDINQVAEMLVKDRKALIRSRGLVLESNWDHSMPRAWGDPKLLGLVVTNLVTNAANYTPRGGRISVTTGTDRSNGAVWNTLSVTDNGMGIPENELPHLFERFYRGSAAKAASAPGTGLGLAIVKEIIEMQHGQVTVNSAVGLGTTFTVYLPVEK